jgi:isopentenyl-diphosphate Delta-isomerase
MEKILLVDKEDNIIGSEEKILVHKKGLLHRAFSILIFNSKNEVLIQQRALGKYHSGGLWSNTCCSHQREGEKLYSCIHKRLRGEMGFDCVMSKKFIFHYKSTLNNNLIENEVDHVFFGKFNGNPLINTLEVMNFKWISYKELEESMKNYPLLYTIWFREIMKILFENYEIKKF